ncbi:Uncharacterized protein MJ1295 [hydrothermal vent metagenome]|uniref:Uncharacterized protein MJ1295 n=1 Tax=hydrothermal vent metagenome TaxID=652676 RepID=A0A3B1CT72_9ZZZZ
MIDLHTHSLFSDGELIPSELVRRAQNLGYRAIAITDHVDYSNCDVVVPQIAAFCENAGFDDIKVIPGAEITHVPPGKIGALTEKLRTLGAKLVLVHGETVVEPVAKGTNRAAIEAGVDIVAHPGLVNADDAKLAADKRVAFELSGRGGHSFTNGHVFSMAREHGVSLVFSTDAHAPRDLMNRKMAEKVIIGAGATGAEADAMFDYAQKLVERF